MLAAAVVSKTFRDRLLCDPAQALREGYQHQSFALQPVERAALLSLRASSLAEFAAQLMEVIAAHDPPPGVAVLPVLAHIPGDIPVEP